jgi:hypothetical protein
MPKCDHKWVCTHCGAETVLDPAKRELAAHRLKKPTRYGPEYIDPSITAQPEGWKLMTHQGKFVAVAPDGRWISQEQVRRNARDAQRHNVTKSVTHGQKCHATYDDIGELDTRTEF